MATINAINSNIPIEVSKGGTGNTSLTIHTVLLGNSTSAITQLANGTTGQVLTAVTGSDPAWSAPSGGVTSLAGTANQITASAATGAVTLSIPSTFIAPGTIAATTTVTAGTNLISTAGNLALPTTSTTIGQITIGGSPFAHALGTLNCFFGVGAGNLTFTTGSAVVNTAVGVNALNGVTTGDHNWAGGYGALQTCTTGNFNSACGVQALGNATNTGTLNTASGYLAMGGVTSGGNNCSYGAGSGNTFTTGSYNALYGRSAGTQLATSDSHNICINNQGTAGNNNTLRIGAGTGTGTQQLNASFIHGIFGITVGVSGIPVVVDNAGQLGTVVSSSRFKENIEDMGSYSDGLMKMRPVVFNYKEDVTKSRSYGLIAEEVNEVMPDLVVHDLEGEIMTIKYHELAPILLNEIQKISARVKQLERRCESFGGLQCKKCIHQAQ